MHYCLSSLCSTVCRVHEPNGHPLTRQYTPISPLDQRNSFAVLIKVTGTVYSLFYNFIGYHIRCSNILWNLERNF